jgi:hypothetical protein
MFLSKLALAIFGKQGNSRHKTGAGQKHVRLEVVELESRCLPSTHLFNAFAGLGSADNGFLVEPPDTQVAAGPHQVLEVVNNVLAVYDKGGNNLFQEDLSSFFAPVQSGDFLSDPIAGYDAQAGRFIVGTLDIAQDENGVDQASYFDLAVSNDANPLDGFSMMTSIDVSETGDFGQLLTADYPKFGTNADAYVFTFNMFDTDDNFDHVQILTIDKSSALDGNPDTLTYYQVDRFSGDYTLAPASTHDSDPGDPLWFVEEDNGFSTLRLVEMNNVLSDTPDFQDFVVSVPSYDAAAAPAEPDGQPVTDQIDTSILGASMAGNILVTSQNVGDGLDTHARWYEFDVGGDNPALLQSGEIDPGPGIDTYFPAIDINAQGDLGMSYLQSSAGEYMSMYVTGRTPFDSPGAMEAPARVAAGQADYLGTRAGDYSGIAVDPATDSFWAANEFASNDDSPNWGTALADFAPISPPTLSVIPNQTLSHTKGFLAVQLHASDPNNLPLHYNVTLSSVPSGIGAVAGPGGLVTISGLGKYAGTFWVTANVSDGLASASRQFQVTVTDQPPQLAAVANQTISHTKGSLTLALKGGDADNDPLSY